MLQGVRCIINQSQPKMTYIVRQLFWRVNDNYFDGFLNKLKLICTSIKMDKDISKNDYRQTESTLYG